MVDINAYINELEQERVDLQELINRMYNRADGSGEAAEYNNAVVGLDVKDRIVKLALLIRVMIKKTSGDIDGISGERKGIEDILSALEGKDINALADFVTVAMDQMDYNGVTPFTFVKDKYIPEILEENKLDVSNPADSSIGYCYAILPCKTGDVLCVSGNSYSGYYPRAWYFINSEYTIIAKEDSNVVVTNKMLVAPINVAYCVVHARMDALSQTIPPSYRGRSLSERIDANRKDLSLYKEGYEPLESGTMVVANGRPATVVWPNRIRNINYLPLSVYKAVQYPLGWTADCYAYDENYTLCGPDIYYSTGGVNADSVLAVYPLAKYIKIVSFLRDDRSLDITDRIEWLEKHVVYTRRGEAASFSYPELTAQQKAAIKSLADDYFAARGKFHYNTAATINSYTSKANIVQDGQYKICCSLLAEMLWMGRNIADFPDDINAYTNAVTRAFNFGYYFDFMDREYAYGIVGHPDTYYYGFRNPFNDTVDFKGSYSFNSYYSGANTNRHQSFNQFLYANDMAKECDRKGYTIPVSELQTGDLLFIQKPVRDQQNDTFSSIAYKNITHVAIVYERIGDHITIIDSTTESELNNAPIYLCSSDDEEPWRRARVAYLMSNVVMCARHPAAWGVATNVPAAINPK